MKVIMATTNPNKVREIKEMLEGTNIEVSSLADLGIDAEIEENGSTFEENALIKASKIAKQAKGIVLADDSGLEIDALDGKPGIHSARFMDGAPYEEKCAEILRQMSDVPDDKRSARFICAMAMVYPDGRKKTFEGRFEGYISREYKGTNGFGYDPIFFVPEFGKTSAEMLPEEKNAVSHRGKALKMVVEELKKEQTENK